MSDGWFRAWQAFCTVLSLGVLGVFMWAIVRFAERFT